MGIHVYITRAADPFDDGPPITAEEWARVADAEPDFRPARPAEEPPGSAATRVWTGHPRVPAWVFAWYGGQVDVKNPDAPTIVRMRQLAARLGATVFSEQGELFDERGQHAGFLPDCP